MISPIFYVFYLKNNYFTQISIPRLIAESNISGIAIATTGLWEYQLTPIYLLIFAAGLIIVFYRKIAFRWQFLLWIIIPNMIVSLMPHWKSARQVLPAHPAFAVIGSFALAWMLEKIHQKRSQIVAVSMIVAVGVLQIFDLVYSKKLVNLHIRELYYFKEDNNANLQLEKRKENEIVMLSLFKIIRSLGVPSVSIQVQDLNTFDIYFLISRYCSARGINCWVQGPEILGDNLENRLKYVSLLILCSKSSQPEQNINKSWSFDNLLACYNNTIFSHSLNPITNEDIAYKRKIWESFILRYEPIEVFTVSGSTYSIYGLKNRNKIYKTMI
jgi:hypothetical protein